MYKNKQAGNVMSLALVAIVLFFGILTFALVLDCKERQQIMVKQDAVLTQCLETLRSMREQR